MSNKNCKICGSSNTVKNGKNRGKQRYKCKDCGKQFLENSSFPQMRKPETIIATGLDLYFEGLSVRKVARQIAKIFGVDVDHSTIWDWIQKYSSLVKDFVDSLEIEVGGDWQVDETLIKSKGDVNPWFWEVIDKETKFMVASYLSKSRSEEDTIELLRRAKKKAKDGPNRVSSIC